MALTADDIVAATQLYERYNSTLDKGDADGFAACFTADGHLDTGMGPSEGNAAIHAFVAEVKSMVPGLRHLAHSIVIDGDGDHASGSAFLVGYDVSAGFNVLATGQYADELVRNDAGWQFSRRVFTADA